MESIAIVFSHYGMNEVATQNAESFRRNNPGSDVILSAFDTNEIAPQLLPFFERCKADSKVAWAATDLLFYNSFLTRKRSYSKWLFAEWDAYCNSSIRDFFAETWHYDAVATSVTTPNREPEWHWFRNLDVLPSKMRRFACGLKPITASLFSEDTLARMVEAFLKTPFDAFCELRMGTLANYVNAQPVPNPRSTHTISWRRVPAKAIGKGIFHPIKYKLAEADSPKPTQDTWRVFTVVHRATPLIGHFVKHYASLGFTDIHIAVHEECAPIDWDALRASCAARIHQEKSYRGSYHYLKDTSVINGLKATHVKDDEWSAAADIDEFYEYPAPLSEIAWHADDSNCVIGHFVDRFGPEFELCEIRPDVPIFDQFPLEENFTGQVLRQPTRKVMLMKGPHPYAEGHHRLYIPFDASELPYFEEGHVHHFKWHSGLVEYLDSRFATERLDAQPRIRADLERLRAFLEERDTPDAPEAETTRADHRKGATLA